MATLAGTHVNEPHSLKLVGRLLGHLLMNWDSSFDHPVQTLTSKDLRTHTMDFGGRCRSPPECRTTGDQEAGETPGDIELHELNNDEICQV